MQIIMLITGCSQVEQKVRPANYNLANPVIYKMPATLDEISGITFLNGNADTIFAEQDEEGKVFYFHPGDKVVSHTKFSKRGDYEDVAICSDYVVMLRSDGVLFTFPLNEIHNKEIMHVSEQDGLLPPGEYESLCSVQRNRQLYVLCKSCGDDISTERMSGHIFQLANDGRLIAKADFSVDSKKIAALAGLKKLHFKPSALAQNPITKDWYILSSVNKMLLTTNDQWTPEHIYNLPPTLFTQPEGIAFDNAGNLYISNEIGNGQNGTILLFLNQKNKSI
jgi:hypothetical protein